MSNPSTKNRAVPRPVRVPAERAAGLPAELTAQPRQLSDEIGPSDSVEEGLSVEPEDLAARFLSGAIEQGEASSHPLMDVELSLGGGADSDEVLTPPNFEYENTMWEQTVDLTLQTGGAASQLRAPLAFEDDAETQEPEPRVSESSIRGLSLFDREEVDENEENSEIEPPELPEDGGRHAQTTVREPLGPQLNAAAPEAPAAISGGVLREHLQQAARWVLLHFAAALRALAGR